MHELNLQDYGQLKQGQLCHVSAVVIGAVNQIIWLSTSWEHGGCFSWLPYVWVGPLISSGQYVVIGSDVCCFWTRMLICQSKPFRGSFFLSATFSTASLGPREPQPNPRQAAWAREKLLFFNK